MIDSMINRLLDTHRNSRNRGYMNMRIDQTRADKLSASIVRLSIRVHV